MNRIILQQAAAVQGQSWEDGSELTLPIRYDAAVKMVLQVGGQLHMLAVDGQQPVSFGIENIRVTSSGDYIFGNAKLFPVSESMITVDRPYQKHRTAAPEVEATDTLPAKFHISVGAYCLCKTALEALVLDDLESLNATKLHWTAQRATVEKPEARRFLYI
jgi:hypothetical protein